MRNLDRFSEPRYKTFIEWKKRALKYLLPRLVIFNDTRYFLIVPFGCLVFFCA